MIVLFTFNLLIVFIFVCKMSESYAVHHNVLQPRVMSSYIYIVIA